VVHLGDDLVIQAILTALIPESVVDNDLTLSIFAKLKAVPQIIGKGDRQIICFECMK
jgi:hypothetical protein